MGSNVTGYHLFTWPQPDYNPFYLFPGLMFVLLVLCSILWDYLKDPLAINVFQ